MADDNLTADDVEPIGQDSAPVSIDKSDIELVEAPPKQGASSVRRFARKTLSGASTVASEVGDIAGKVGTGLKNVAEHPIAFAEGLIPGASEAQKAYSEGLTPRTDFSAYQCRHLGAIRATHTGTSRGRGT